ncbi:uncharacterized protein [Amphiura filiformis]|uniref:uncharacterized protein n=1 Tax=Amphiura filiformis TaxID=82378 RepID=UPI003B20EE30
MDAYLPIKGTEQAVHVQLRQGDITRQKTDAIINFRPSWFREHASGVSTPSSAMVIMEAAGSRVESEYLTMRVKGGFRVIMTSGGNLRQKKIIHITHFYEPTKLQNAVFMALRLADKEHLKSIVFPVLDCSDSLQQLVSSLYKAFDNFARQYRPEFLHLIQIVVPDRRTENFYLAVRELHESSTLVDVMYKEPMREVLEATGMICTTTEQLEGVTLIVRYIQDDDDEDSIPRQNGSHAVVGFCTDDGDDDEYFVDNDSNKITNYQGLEKWYTQRSPVVPEGVNESNEINLALNRLGYDGSWGDGSSFGVSRRGLIFVFYEGIRFELGNRSPCTFQIVEDVRSPVKHIWLRNMVHKALRLTDQRGFEEITFVIKRTVCGSKTDALYIIEGVNNFASYYHPIHVRSVNIVTASGNVFDAFKAGQRLHKWMKNSKHLECRHQKQNVASSNTSSISFPEEQKKYKIILSIVIAIIACILMFY